MGSSRREFLSWFAASVLTVRFQEKMPSRQWREIESEIDGTIGAAALHLSKGTLLTLHGSEKFPLASVCKLPIAMNILAMVDERKLALTDLIDIPPYDVWPGVSVIAEQWPAKRSFTLDEMLSMMVASSDNTAVETLWRVGGRAPAMTRRFRQWRIDGIRLDRSERECGLSQFGVTRVPKTEEWTPTLLDELTSQVPPATRLAAMRAFTSDPRDTATPRAVVELLRRTYRSELLSRSSTSRLIQILESTTTGAARLKGLLPPDTVVAHKTGTTGTEQGFTAGTNDVGVITLPRNAGKMAIAVFIKGSTAGMDAMERAIAKIARATFDMWA